MAFDVLEQALSAEGFVIAVPTLPGSSGEGKKLANALADRVDLEGDFDDLIAIIEAVKEIPDVDPKRIAIVGVGQGGAAAITLAAPGPDCLPPLPQSIRSRTGMPSLTPAMPPRAVGSFARSVCPRPTRAALPYALPPRSPELSKLPSS